MSEDNKLPWRTCLLNDYGIWNADNVCIHCADSKFYHALVPIHEASRLHALDKRIKELESFQSHLIKRPVEPLSIERYKEMEKNLRKFEEAARFLLAWNRMCAPQNNGDLVQGMAKLREAMEEKK